MCEVRLEVRRFGAAGRCVVRVLKAEERAVVAGGYNSSSEKASQGMRRFQSVKPLWIKLAG
jgi:hypothetical protein